MDDRERYNKACHAMQTGVAYEHANGSDDGSPKHLRVGVNTAQVSTAALAALLIGKGIITIEEYVEVNATEMEAEVKRYQDRAPTNIRFL